MPAEAPQTSAQRILEAVPLIPPTGALAGWAAAYVLGVDMLDGLDPFTLAPEILTVSLGSTAGRVNHHQIRYVRDRLLPTDRLLHRGIPVTSPTRTAFDGARWAPDLVEAVVFLDQVGHALDLRLDELAGRCVLR